MLSLFSFSLHQSLEHSDLISIFDFDGQLAIHPHIVIFHCTEEELLLLSTRLKYFFGKGVVKRKRKRVHVYEKPRIT